MKPNITQNNSHWASEFLGKKWVSGARGPDKFDCWGLIYFILKTKYKIIVDEYPGIGYLSGNNEDIYKLMAEEADKKWEVLEKPIDGCVCGLSQTKRITHVGLYLDIDGGRVLHSVEKLGVVCQPVSSLLANQFNTIVYYKPKSL